MKSDTPNFFKTYSHLKHASYIVMHDMSLCGPYTYRIYMRVAETQARLGIYAQTRQSLRCSHTQRLDVVEVSGQNVNLCPLDA